MLLESPRNSRRSANTKEFPDGWGTSLNARGAAWGTGPRRRRRSCVGRHGKAVLRRKARSSRFRAGSESSCPLCGLTNPPGQTCLPRGREQSAKSPPTGRGAVRRERGSSRALRAPLLQAGHNTLRPACMSARATTSRIRVGPGPGRAESGASRLQRGPACRARNPKPVETEDRGELCAPVIMGGVRDCGHNVDTWLKCVGVGVREDW